MVYTAIALQQRLKEAIESYSYPTFPENLYNPVAYIMNLGGKRVRPCLLLMGKNLFSDDVNESLPLALGLEFFHNFSLMHDDIMDKAPLRRGKQTVHEKWDNNTAILSGDAMIVEAYSLMCSGKGDNLTKILVCFNKMARQVCEGQQLDMDFEIRTKVSLPEYLEMIRLKTAVLLGAALQIGALDAGADDFSANLLFDVGCDMGIAFQLQDDMLDVYGTEEIFGKQVGGDILSNKKTWLLLNAIEAAEPDDLKEIEALMNSGRENPIENKIARMTALYDKLLVKECTLKAIDFYTTQARQNLSRVNVNYDRKQVLSNLLDSISKRES